MTGLPQGYVVDEPESKLPEGYEIDRPASENSWLGTAAKAVTGVPEEALRTTQETMKGAAQDFRDSLLPRQGHPGEGFWEGYGKDLAAIPSRAGKLVRGIGAAATAPLAPLYGAGKSLIGRPMAHAIHSAGEVINPEAAAKHTPEDIYQDIREDVGSALGTTSLGSATKTIRPGIPTNTPKTAIPSLAERKAAAKSAYDNPVVKNAEIKPQPIRNLANVIEGDLIKAGFSGDPASASGTFSALRRMRPKVNQNAPVTIPDLDIARRSFSQLAKGVDATGAATAEAAAAQKVVGHIDHYLLNLKQSDLFSGSAKDIGKILGEARQDWASYKRGQMVDTLESNADATRASTYGGGNANNAIRQKFRPATMNNMAKLRGWSPEAKTAFSRVVSGGPLYSGANIARQIGRFAPDSKLGFLLHGLTGGGLFAAGISPAVAIPIATATYAAKKLGIALTRSNVEKVREILAKESALYQARHAAAGPPTVAKRAFIPPAMWTQIPGHDRENPPGTPGMNPYAP